MAPEAELNYYVNDWLLVAPSATADSFVAISDFHAAYRKALKDEVGIYAEWLHFYWAAHIHHALDVAAGVRPALEAGTDVGLARGVGNGGYCRANRSVAAWLPPAREGPVWGGMQTALCPRVGQVRCPFESHFCSAQALEGSAR